MLGAREWWVALGKQLTSLLKELGRAPHSGYHYQSPGHDKSPFQMIGLLVESTFLDPQGSPFNQVASCFLHRATLSQTGKTIRPISRSYWCCRVLPFAVCRFRCSALSFSTHTRARACVSYWSFQSSLLCAAKESSLMGLMRDLEVIARKQPVRVPA